MTGEDGSRRLALASGNLRAALEEDSSRALVVSFLPDGVRPDGCMLASSLCNGNQFITFPFCNQEGPVGSPSRWGALDRRERDRTHRPNGKIPAHSCALCVKCLGLF